MPITPDNKTLISIGGDLAPSLGGTEQNFLRKRFLNDLFLVIDHILKIFPIFTVYGNVMYDTF